MSKATCHTLNCTRPADCSIVVDTWSETRGRWYSRRVRVCRVCHEAYVEGVNRGLHMAAGNK